MPITTRRGDSGETDLRGAQRIPKDSPRIRALGDADELNSLLGVALSQHPAEGHAEIIRRIQREVFCAGNMLATPPGSASGRAAVLEEAHIVLLEGEIANWEAALPPLRAFLLPGGTSAAATLFLARAVCRRLERSVVAICREEPLDPILVRFLNRLSDELFLMARAENLSGGGVETTWEGRCGE